MRKKVENLVIAKKKKDNCFEIRSIRKLKWLGNPGLVLNSMVRILGGLCTQLLSNFPDDYCIKIWEVVL